MVGRPHLLSELLPIVWQLREITKEDKAKEENKEWNIVKKQIHNVFHNSKSWDSLDRNHKTHLNYRCTWWSLSGMSAAPVGTGCTGLGRDVAFPENLSTVEPSPGLCTHSEPGLCSGTESAECYSSKEGGRSGWLNPVWYNYKMNAKMQRRGLEVSHLAVVRAWSLIKFRMCLSIG